MSSKDAEEPFAEVLVGALLKTFSIFIGEVNYDDFVKTMDVNLTTAAKNVSWNAINSRESLKTKLALGQLILTAFVFLFAVVLMNLLNAIAIGDIQVNVKLFLCQSQFYQNEALIISET